VRTLGKAAGVSGPIEIIVIIAVIGYILAKRLIGEPAEVKRMLLLPAILTVAGLVSLAQVAQSPVSIWFLIGTAIVSAVIGLLRGATVRVFERDGIVFMRYRVMTVILWGVNLAIRFGASFVLGMIDPKAEHATSNGLMLTLGIGMLVEGLGVLSKAVRLRGQVVWEKGKDGKPHTTSTFFDGLQEKVQTTDWSAGRGQNGRTRQSSLWKDLRNLDFRQPYDGDENRDR
jgi:hypothetical protein